MRFSKREVDSEASDSEEEGDGPYSRVTGRLREDWVPPGRQREIKVEITNAGAVKSINGNKVEAPGDA